MEWDAVLAKESERVVLAAASTTSSVFFLVSGGGATAQQMAKAEGRRVSSSASTASHPHPAHSAPPHGSLTSISTPGYVFLDSARSVGVVLSIRPA